MKKLYSLLLAIITVLSLAACGEKNSTADNGDTAATYPEKSIDLIIGFSPGGGADLTARAVFQPFVEDILGQDIIISYQAGSNGEISYTELAKNTDADGYTMCWGAHPGFLTMPLTKTSCKFTLEDFQPVCNIATDPNVFIVYADSEFSTLDDIVTYAKANPGKLTVAIGALNADDDLALEQFIAEAGIEVNKVVYADGTTDRVTACMGKHVEVCVLNASEVTTYIDQVKILGVMTEERLDFITDVPTFAEQGYEAYNSSDRGILMPAGVDEEIVKRMSDAIQQAMETPECQEKMAMMNLIPNFMDYKEYSENLVKMRDIYQGIIDANAAK